MDLYELSKSIFEGFSNQFREKGIDAKIMGDEAHVVADRKRIGQVITNLLSNAIKYTDEKGSISVLVKRDTTGTITSPAIIAAAPALIGLWMNLVAGNILITVN